MRLPPLLRLGIPKLDGQQTGPGHAEVRSIENVARLPIHIHGSIAETKDLEGRKLAAEVHRNKLSPAFLVGACHPTKYGAPGLAWLVPGRHRLVGYGADGRVLVIKVVDTRRRLLEEFSTTMT